MPDVLNNATLTANNEVVPYIPGSLKSTEGLGEYKMTALTVGGGRTVPLFSVDQTTALSAIKFDLPPTVDGLALARRLKTNLNRNVFTITASNQDGTFTRTYQQSAVLNDYEAAYDTDGTVPIEAMGLPAV